MTHARTTSKEYVFCYELHALAEIAHDTETGEPTSAYAQVKISFENEIEFIDYDRMHREVVPAMMERQSKIPLAYIQPISEADYTEATGA